jgi:hypothetical protein
MGLVDRGGEAVRIGEPDQGFAPGPLMRRCQQDAVDIKNAGAQDPARAGPHRPGCVIAHLTDPLCQLA